MADTKIGEIEKGVPMPSDIRRNRRLYPFPEMEVGDSLLIQDETRTFTQIRAAIHGTIRLGTNRATGFKFVTRKEGPHAVRVWRYE